MKILHTSDWHIGKKLMGRDRYEEHKAVLLEIAELCKNETVDLVLVAGDIFDTYTPSAEAEEIFYNSVKEIAKHSAVLVISGNHDDYVRLTAASKLIEELNIYIIGNNLCAVSCKERGNTYPIKSGEGFVIFKNKKGEKVFVNTLPYPNEARFKEGKTNESFNEKIERWINLGEIGKEESIPSIFMSHIFAAGGSVSDTEREIDLGGARVVPLNLFPNCDYAALGHLHKRQQLGKNNYYYSGAIMQFSFDESNTEKSVNLFDLDEEGVKNFKQIALTKLVNLVRLQADSVDLAIELLNNYTNCFVELTLNLNEPMTATQSTALRSAKNLVSLKTNIDTQNTEEFLVSNKNKTSSQLFDDYYRLRYDGLPSQELKALFLSLTEEE
ncbi:MAG: exonuclease subunit SbcD [Clostridiales bacterium]|nr:exonuclease subunit SbcD [Clostridiales bacterium]